MNLDATERVSADADELARQIARIDSQGRELLSAIERAAVQAKRSALDLGTVESHLRAGAALADHIKSMSSRPLDRGLVYFQRDESAIAEARLHVAAAEYYERENARARAEADRLREDARFKNPRPPRWGGDLVSHAVAAWILQYRSGPTGTIASGDTLLKAIGKARKGDPLAELGDKSPGGAKDARSGKLRRQAVEWVARERGVDVEGVYRGVATNPNAPRSLRKYGKARSEHALSAE